VEPVTPVFRLCADYVSQRAALDPVSAAVGGSDEPFRAVTDYGPDGIAARAGLIASTLSTLDATPVTSEPDRQAAALLRERLRAEAAWHEIGEPFRLLRAQFGLTSMINNSVHLLPRADAGDWQNIAARMAAVPVMLGSWRASLEEGLRRGLPAARRQAIETARQLDTYGGSHDALLTQYAAYSGGERGPLAAGLAAAASQEYQGYAEMARYLREDYAPRASETDAVGPERYAVEGRLHLGADVDFADAYQWGWAELGRIEAEMAAEAALVAPGAGLDEAAAILDQTESVTGAEAYRDWIAGHIDRAIGQLDGVFDLATPLRAVDTVLVTSATAGAPYYTAPSNDLTRHGSTWWPLAGRERFAVWRELASLFHESVPGHHMQASALLMAGDRLSRFSVSARIFAHGEGWAHYAERLADELGWYDAPGTRLGWLQMSALRAARVVIDIGLHLDLPLPDGSRWSFEKAGEVLRERGRAEQHLVHPEIVRYCAWPAQATTFKLGERAWLAARAEAMRRPAFDLKRWHAAALALGPIGLDGLAETLRGIDI
jgi:uncharacterized protein (DUF885 family)